MIRTTALLASCLLVVTLFTGCNNTITSNDLRDNWTPELYSTSMSKEEFTNFKSRHKHNTWRQLHDDWAMLWLRDRNYSRTDYNLP